MQTWAKRGLQTTLVTGGLLMLGTGIAAASENASPDVPPSPIDLPTPTPGTGLPANAIKEAESLTNITSAVGGNNAIPVNPGGLEHVIGAPASVNSGSAPEWGPFSGDLLASPSHHATLNPDSLSQTSISPVNLNPTKLNLAHLGQAPAVLKVPTSLLGQAMTTPGSPANPAEGEPGQAEFGPKDSVDNLMRVDQVPAIGDLLNVPYLRQRLPLLPAQVPAQPGAPGRYRAQSAPAAPGLGYQPMAGELPVTGQLPGTTPPSVPAIPAVPALPSTSGVPVNASIPALSKPTLPVPTAAPSLPAVPAAPSLPAPGPTPSLHSLPDLPPVPTLPAMPQLPGRPSTQDQPAGSTGVSALNTPNLPTLAAPTIAGPSLPTLPGLPALPTRPTTHDLPAPPTAGSGVSTPSLFTPNVPAVPAPALPPLPSLPAVSPVPAPAGPHTQDVPAGSASQLMAQLRALISSIDDEPGTMHPMGGR